MRQRRLDEAKVRIDICFERPIEFLVRDVLDPLLSVLVRSITDKDIESSQCGDRLIDKGEAEVPVGKVALDHQASTSLIFYSFPSFFRINAFVRKTSNRDVGALARVQDRNGSANARV